MVQPGVSRARPDPCAPTHLRFPGADRNRQRRSRARKPADGDRIAATVAGTQAERYLMWTLAALTVASVLFVLFLGGKA